MKHYTTKLLSALLATAILPGLGLAAITNTDTTEITLSLNELALVNSPATIEFGSLDANTGETTQSGGMCLASNSGSVDVSAAGEGELQNGNGDAIDYDLKISGFAIATNGTAITFDTASGSGNHASDDVTSGSCPAAKSLMSLAVTITPSDHVVPAGSYSDTVTFSVEPS